VQLDTQPEELARLERRLLQLEIEATALAAEKNNRLAEVQTALSALRRELEPLRARHAADKERANELQRVRRKIATLEAMLVQSENARDLQRIADIRHGSLPAMKEHLAALEKAPAPAVSPAEIARVVALWTHVPVEKLTASEATKVLELRARLGERILGQPKALDAIADAIVRSRAGMAPARRPTGSFLFVGPPGTGKTETAKALADDLFAGALVRLDMSEYMEPHSVARLIGAPPGHEGYEDGGQLTEAVRHKPFSVVLLDEADKAHANVLNVLLQVLDGGRLTDGLGRTVDFTNCVIILTSNQDAEPHMVKRARLDDIAFLRPELLNRFDDVVVFEPLSDANLSSIARVQLDDMTKAVRADKDIRVSASDGVVQRAVAVARGARPLRRFLESAVGTHLATGIANGLIPARSHVHFVLANEAQPSDERVGGLAMHIMRQEDA